MSRMIGILIVMVAAGAAAYWVLQPDRAQGPQPFLGYVEAETLLMAPKQSGRLVELTVSEGAVAAADAPLFALDADSQNAAVEEAAARLGQARARLADLRAARLRPAEIEMLKARRRAAEAALEQSRTELKRQQRLFPQGVSTEAQLDQARTSFQRDRNAVAEVEWEIEAARLSAREAEINAAEAEVEAGAAALKRVRVALAERKVSASHGGRVLDILYQVGEVVPAGQPVVEVLPPESIRVNFYVPEPAVAGLTYGQRVAISCDGCPGDLTGEISFIASETEFTPPVIFSRRERAKLVFLVKARPTAAAPSLKPGLPVEVRPL